MVRPGHVLFILLVWAGPAQAAPTSQPASAPAPSPTSSPASAPASRPAHGPATSPVGPLPPDTPGLDHTGTPPPPRDEGLPAPSAAPGRKRPLPDYDGRPPPEASAGDVLIWVPRALLFPAHLVLEHVVRRPIVGLATFVEKHHIQSWIRRLFVYRDGKAGLFPTALYEFGLDPSIGFFFFYDDLFHPAHDIVLKGGFWTTDWARLELDDRVAVFRDDSGLIETNLLYLRRPDRPFYGIGADTREGDEGFYRVELLQARLGLSGRLSGLDRTTLELAYRRARFTDGEAPVISDRFAVGDPAVVPGFGGYDLLSAGARVVLDSRSPDRVYTSGTGLRLELRGSFNVDPTAPELRFVRWGGGIGGFVDLSGENHVLGLRAELDLVENTGEREVPFTELATLGGRERMPGFLEGRFRGASTFLVTAEYRYPIWALMDASLFVGAGNAFGEHLAGLHAKRLHLTWGLGLRTNKRRDVSFDALLGFGSNRFDAGGFKVDHVHFVFGVNAF
jgi:hypothetical protein